MHNEKKNLIRLAIPSKGELEKPTLNFLATCGLKVFRPNPRQYVASVSSAPQIVVLFQRAADILRKVDEGSVGLGITGFDIVAEQSGGRGHDDVIVIKKKLGYGGCELVLAVPESWVDVSFLEDLADLTTFYKDKNREFRIATKYPNLTKKWLYNKGIMHFTLIGAQGALEAAPSLGYADMIVDITSTGTTLRENRLKQIAGGIILESEACLIGNKKFLQPDSKALQTVEMILELIEAQRRAREYVSITANICGDSAKMIAKKLINKPALAGLNGPTISKVYSKTWGAEDWYAVTIVVKQHKLLGAIAHLRKVGGTDITVTIPNYLFDAQSRDYEKLKQTLSRERV